MTLPVGSSASATNVPAHRAFFEALGVLPEGSPGWRAVLAGLVTLRYLDAWSDARVAAADLSTERQAVEDAISVLPAHVPERIYLAGLVDALTPDRPRDLTCVVSLLLAYGRALQRRSSWALAADVFARAYEACMHVAQQPVQRELAASAALRAGQCYRELGDPAAAERAYGLALALGHDAGDEYAIRRAHVALARLAADRGGPLTDDDAGPLIVHDEVSKGPADLPQSAEKRDGPPRGPSDGLTRGGEPRARH